MDFKMFVRFNVLMSQCTYEDFPLPVGPKIAFKPGRMIPLKKRERERDLIRVNSLVLSNSSSALGHKRHFQIE